MAFSGLRVSELAGLTWADIDLVDRVVRVDRQLAPLRRGEEPRRVRPKSQASVREVPLLDRVYEALLAQPREEQAKGLGSASDYVFTSLTGRPLGRDRLSKRGVLGATKRAGSRTCDRPDAPPFRGDGDGARSGSSGRRSGHDRA
jgi:integrase